MSRRLRREAEECGGLVELFPRDCPRSSCVSCLALRHGRAALGAGALLRQLLCLLQCEPWLVWVALMSTTAQARVNACVQDLTSRFR